MRLLPVILFAACLLAAPSRARAQFAQEGAWTRPEAYPTPEEQEQFEEKRDAQLIHEAGLSEEQRIAAQTAKEAAEARWKKKHRTLAAAAKTEAKARRKARAEARKPTKETMSVEEIFDMFH